MWSGMVWCCAVRWRLHSGGRSLCCLALCDVIVRATLTLTLGTMMKVVDRE